jgi:hypothetical protein
MLQSIGNQNFMTFRLWTYLLTTNYNKINYLYMKNKLSLIAIFIAALWTWGTINNYKDYRNGGEWNNIFPHDMFSYYVYLPATFVYQCDYDYAFTETIPENKPGYFAPVTAPATGKKVNKVTFGMAMLFAPFYIAADKYIEYVQPTFDAKRDGYSLPYRIAMKYATLIYVIIALFLLRRFLKRHFDDEIVALTLLGVLLGTNLFHYTVNEGMMTHAPNFFLYSLFLYLTQLWYEKQRGRTLFFLGMTLSLITLVRPTNIIIGLFFLLFRLSNWAEIKARCVLIYEKKGQFLLATLAAIALFFPQLYLWKIKTGQWFFFSYYEGERFYWTEPAIVQGFFSYCKGWFVYSPLMFFAAIGLFLVKKYAKDWFLPLVVFFALNSYIVLSWWSWWYGGGFGLRAFVEATAPMSIGLAAFFTFLKEKIRYWRLSFLPLFLLIALNIFQTRQYKIAYIRWNGMTKERYWGVFGKYRLTPEEHAIYDEMYEEPHR